MSPTTRYVAELTDPLTGEVLNFSAGTAGELDEQLDAYLAAVYPLVPVDLDSW